MATKSDKIPKGKWQKHQKVIEKELEKDPSDPVVLFSSETGQGKEEAWKKVQYYVSQGSKSQTYCRDDW